VLQADPAQKFSSRTSIHVHVNCSAYDEEAVRRIIWLYALFEEAFFLMVERDRRDNIHCVPLTETHLPAMYRDTMPRLVDRWSKYTALNIKPLSSYGTLEFRHMHGHDDPILLQEWLGSINNLFNVALVNPRIDAKFLQDDNLESVFNKIFGDTRLKHQWVLVRGMMVNQIIDIKLAV
jgi:Putative amidoligase enzyme